MPDAAAINYGENDVRHFTEGDAMDVAGMSRSTRQLAQRDVALAKTLNLVVQSVNNKEQFIPLPIVRTTLPPNSEEIVANYRIPPGFEARVLNAIITSVPASSSAELDVYYAVGYGNSTGTGLVSTSTEFTAGTAFYAEGEFIITLKNRGGATLEQIGSVMLTMRPITERQGVLIPSVPPTIIGPPGQQGPIGPGGGAGPVGPTGSPGLIWQSTWSNVTTYDDKAVVFWQGSSWKSKHTSNTGNQPDASPSDWEFVAREGDPGFNWLGPWSSLTSYAVNDGVSFNGSSYVCVVATTPGQSPATTPSSWNLIAEAGENGFNYRGVWTSSPSPTPYVLDDVVTVSSNGTNQTYVAVVPTPNPSLSPPTSDWQLLFNNVTPGFSTATVPGTIYTEADFVSLDAAGDYAAIPPGTATFDCQELMVRDTVQSHGMAFLRMAQYRRWIGSITMKLPSIAWGSQIDWSAAMVNLSVVDAGTRQVQTTPDRVNGPSIHQESNKFTITCQNGDGYNLYLSAIGLVTF